MAAGEEGRIAQECVEGYLYATDPLTLLLFRRPPERGSIWVPISGKVDPTDVDYPSALRRELEEETGLLFRDALIDLDWHPTWTTDRGETWRLHAYGVPIARTFAPRLSREHSAFEWVEPSEAVVRLHYADNRDAVRRLVMRLASPSPNA
jgi:8-oxo-dGTP pyrophosphatase MutT (NUDIX family)